MKISTTIFCQITLVVLLFFAFSFSLFGAEVTATLSFADKAQRTSYSKTQQVWQQNGITFTNNKASSSNAVADYANPVRLYANSEIIVEFLGNNITKIVFDCNNGSYATTLKNSIGNSATISSDKVTVTLDGTSTSFVVAKLTAQVRMDAITVTYSSGSEPDTPECEPLTISFDESSIIKINGDANFTNNLNKGGSNGSVTYSSSNTNVATIDDTGKVTIKGVGETTITAIVAEDGTYCEDSAKYTLTVNGRIFNIIWMNGDKVYTTTTYIEGESLVFPAAPEPSSGCQFEGWEFAGWSEMQITEDTPEVTLVSNPYMPTKNCVLYAVYKHVTSSINTYTFTPESKSSASSAPELPFGASLSFANTYENNRFQMTSGNSQTWTITGLDIPLIAVSASMRTNKSGGSGSIDIKVGEDTVYELVSYKNTYGYSTDYSDKNFVLTSTDIVGTIVVRIKASDNSLYCQSLTITVGNLEILYNSIPDCADIEEYTITFGDIAIETIDGKIANIPELPDACNVEYSTKVGWSTMSTFGVVAEQPEVIDENTIFIKDTQLYPVYSGEVEKEVSAWLLVKDASTLAVGDNIVIAAKESDYALSTTQNTNNRAQASVSKNGDFITFDSNVQVITLLNGKKIGSFAFFVGTGNLYAASSSSNHLKTKSGIDDDASWSISIESDGTATVKAQGDKTRNLLRYNAANNPPIFSCYASDQNDICIYKKSIVTTTLTEYYICGYETVESGDVYEVEDDFALNTVTLKSNCDQAAQINVTAGSLTAQKVIVEKTIDASRYYFFSLPFNCKIANIVATDASADSLAYYHNYTIFYYDQVKAANNKGAMGSKAWVEITDTAATLKANQGYIIGYLVDEGTATATIKFKSSDAQTISAPADTILNIDDYEWYTDGGVATANGWNLIGMPYYQKPNNGSLSADINVYYATMPNDDGKTYTQTTFANANIAPFTSFFVQTKVAPTFTISAQQNAAPKLIDGRANYASQQKAVISFVDANGAKDQTTIINNPNTTADYEIAYDLVKWIGYAAIPQIYSIQGDDILAFNSLAIDNSTVIPLGVYAHADGEYTFSLDTKSVGDLQGWELYDNEEGKTIRLANEILTVYLEKGKHEGRFELRLQQRVATDCDTAMSNMQTWVENGKLNIDNMPVDARVYIYDAVGRMLYADNEVSASFSYDFPGRGVYSIVVSSAVETIAFKTIY